MSDRVRSLSAITKTGDRETTRQRSQRDRILALLRTAGLAGVTNRELNRIGYRYGARLWELKKQGYSILTESLGGGLYKFTLLGGPSAPELLPVGKSPKKRQASLPLFAGVSE